VIETRIDISPLCNNFGIGPERSGEQYGFNIWRNTFPAEDLPAAGSVVRVAGVGFEFPAGGTGTGDNIRCGGQRITLPGGRYEWIYLLGAAERRTEDEVDLLYLDGSVRTEWLRMSDFWPGSTSRFGEPLAFRANALRYPRHTQIGHRPAIWQQRMPVSVPGELGGLRLPENPAMHVFAVTAVADAEVPRAR
jgi:hypothetical protein